MNCSLQKLVPFSRETQETGNILKRMIVLCPTGRKVVFKKFRMKKIQNGHKQEFMNVNVY